MGRSDAKVSKKDVRRGGESGGGFVLPVKGGTALKYPPLSRAEGFVKCCVGECRRSEGGRVAGVKGGREGECEVKKCQKDM